MSKHGQTEAVVYDLTGMTKVAAVPKQCNNPECRRTFLPNYRIVNKQKINTATISCMSGGDVLFVNNHRGFTIRFLEYHSKLLFRAFTPGRAIQWAYEETWSNDISVMGCEENWHKLYYDAVMYYLFAREFEALNKHKGVVIGDELTETSMRAYDKHVHDKAFLPANPSQVRELVGSAQEKSCISPE